MKKADNPFPISLGQYFAITIPLAACNAAIHVYILMEPGYFDLKTAVNVAIPTFAFVLPVMCLPLGLLVALFSYKGLSYRKKILPATLLVYLVIQILYSLISILALIRHLLDSLDS